MTNPPQNVLELPLSTQMNHNGTLLRPAGMASRTGIMICGLCGSGLRWGPHLPPPYSSDNVLRLSTEQDSSLGQGWVGSGVWVAFSTCAGLISNVTLQSFATVTTNTIQTKSNVTKWDF